MKHRISRSLPLAAVLFAVMLCPHLDAAPGAGTPITLPLVAEKLAPSPEAPVRAFQSIELTRLPNGSYAVRLLPPEAGLELPDVDLRLLVPRAPKAVRGSEALTRIALIQREFNRNEVHHDLPGGSISASRTIAFAKVSGRSSSPGSRAGRR